MAGRLGAALGFAVAVLVGAALAAETQPGEASGDDKPNETRKMLSRHGTVAKLTGIEFQRCRGLTALCPDNCGHSGDYANFEIVGYIAYEKPGEYGDPKGTTYSFQIEDNHKNLKVTKELAENVRTLKPGSYVHLVWQHDYVTRREAGGSASFPERTVTKLESITKEQADELLKNAAK